MDLLYFVSGFDNFRLQAREPFRQQWSVTDQEKASFKNMMDIKFPTNYANQIGIVVNRSEKDTIMPKIVKDTAKVTSKTASLLTENTMPVLVLLRESDTPLANTLEHVHQVHYGFSNGLLGQDLLLTSITEDESITPATPIRNNTSAQPNIQASSTPVGGEPGPSSAQQLGSLPIPEFRQAAPASFSPAHAMQPTADFKQHEYTSFAQPPVVKTEPSNVFLTHPTPGRLKITLPSFNPATDSIEEVLAKLGKLLPLYGDNAAQRSATPTIIYNFLQASNLDHLILNLSSDQLNNFDSFKEAMLARYARVSPATDFYHTTQNIGELEADLLARLTRMWQRIKSSANLDNGDKAVIRERFLGALRDPVTRLKLRESNVSFEDLPALAQRIRSAREVEEQQNTSLQAQINFLQNEIETLRIHRCAKCGLGHEAHECRANPKMKAQHNKNVRNGRFQRQRNFPIPFRGNRGGGRGLPRGGGRSRAFSSRARGRGYINPGRHQEGPRNYLVETDFF